MKLTFILIALFINFFHSPFSMGEEIIDLNDNPKKNSSKKDHGLIINSESEKKKIHIVKLGDTITSISKYYSVEKEQIMQLNNLDDENYIYVGQILKISDKNQIQENAAKAKEAFDNNYHIVQKGESLTEISNKYGVNLNYLIEMNELEDPDSIKVGSKIFLTKKNTITKINEGKNNYGPLTIEQTELKKFAGRMTLDVKNEENKRLIISIDCDANNLDVRRPGRKWRGWLVAEKGFERKIIEDFCP